MPICNELWRKKLIAQQINRDMPKTPNQLTANARIIALIDVGIRSRREEYSWNVVFFCSPR